MTDNTIDWEFSLFSEFTNDQLYQLLQLRQKIFIVEQDCAYLDADGQDQQAIHLLAFDKKNIVAALRLIAADNAVFKSAEKIVIGRLVVNNSYRGSGLGRIAITKAIDYIQQYSGANIICLSGQSYLNRFYRDLGFTAKGDVYLEDGIEHQLFELML
jgi:ElaA protein